MAKSNDPKVRVARPYRGVKRVPRYPKYPFQLRVRPYQIQPFMIAPVLPGETLKNLVHQSRVVSKPLKHSLVGWWCEYYYFYVRMRDIEWHVGTDFIDGMVTDPTNYNAATIRTAIGSGADAKYYHAAGGTNWLKAALQSITEYYFRDEGENWDEATLDGLPLAQVASRNWLDSLTLDDNIRTDRDVDVDLNADGTVTAQEVLQAQQHWQTLREAGLEKLDYEDWIKTFGVNIPERQEQTDAMYRPELLRYNREWAYPVNTVEPTTGVPSSAVSWINAFRADKDRLFKEPGFIIGLQVVKPKAYIKDTTGGLASFMETIENWLPALSHADPEKAFKEFAATSGPLASKLGTTPFEAYWVDMRDLLLYGDQFLNFAPDTASAAISVIDSGQGARNRYASATTIDDLFAAASPANIIQVDGVVDMVIMGRQVDFTPTGPTI